jgi:anti-sigma regulatory factor (Ser/Thr protein kinase)
MVVAALPLSLELPALPEAAARARHAVLEAIDGWPVDRSAVALVVSEAVTNVVLHAYRGRRRPGRVRVRVEFLTTAIEITVSDDGPGMRPRTDSPGAGLGMPLIATLADRVEVVSGRGTSVVARFALGARGGTAPARAGAQPRPGSRI